ncbi:MAG TPA: D-alanyl-D-alanine carboxypeptidase family protein [Phenylobacterium sp.]|nr:D-alanyl-D-alanine carboxypeptidase family protein [Phenylobacterium sp.]
MWKWAWALVILVLVVGFWAWLSSGPARPAGAPAAEARAPLTPAECAGPATFVDAARVNGASLETLAWAPFHRPETGWAIYAPVIAAEVGTACAPDSPGFAAAVAAWQAAHGLAASGRIDPGTVEPMRVVWMLRRPFVVATRDGACPQPPPADQLAEARADEIYGGKTLSLRADALDAYRRLVAAARREVPAAAGDPALLTIFSGFRDPAADEARCAAEQNCGGPERANCSAHRTGLAVDLYLGAAPGLRPDTSDDANRRVLARSPTYLWMVRNAGRFGFVGYPFEPWHWEWSGAPA